MYMFRITKTTESNLEIKIALTALGKSLVELDIHTLILLTC